MKEEKKITENIVKDDALDGVSGGKNQTHTTTYENKTEGDYNVMVKGSGKQVLENFDKLYETGMFDNLKKEG